MRFLSFSVLALVFGSALPAQAAVTALQWQDMLQREVTRIASVSPDIKMQGAVSVEESNNQLKATLPAMLITSPDRSQWSVPAIVMNAPMTAEGTAPVAIILPSTITRMDANKKEIARMALGSQSLNGNWNFGDSYFETLNGNVKNVTFSDSIAKAQSAVGNIALSAAKGSQVQFLITDIRNTTTKDNTQTNSSIAKMNLAYQLPDANRLTLTRIIGLFNPVVLLTENQKFGVTMTTEQVGMTDTTGRTTTMQKLVSDIQLQPANKKVGVKLNTKAYIVKQSPESVYSFLLPQQMDLNASITDLPLELASFAPGMSFTMAKDSLARSGTVIDVTNLMIRTFDQGILNGKGRVKANSDAPLGFVGRVTLQIDNLQELITTMQAQLLQPASGMDRSAKTQALMAAMMLQGMGRKTGNTTEFVVDLTPDGQVMVNGQDFSGIMGKSGGKNGSSMPALPLTPVTGSNI